MPPVKSKPNFESTLAEYTNEVLKGDRVFIPTAWLQYVITEVGYECKVQWEKGGFIVRLSELIYTSKKE